MTITQDRRLASSLRALRALRSSSSAVAVVGAQIPTDSWPTYHGDYSGRRYSTLKQINAANVKGLTLAWVYRVNTSRAGAIVGGEGPDTPPPGHAAGDQVDAADGQRHAVFLGARSRLGGRRAHRPRGLALRLEDARRRPHRQPRRRHPRQLAVLPDAGQLLRLARRRDRQGALAPRDRQHEARVLLDQRADDHRPAGDHRRRRRRARHPRLSRVARSRERAIWCGAGTPRRVRASRAPRPGPTNTRWRTAAACRGFPAPTIPS